MGENLPLTPAKSAARGSDTGKDYLPAVLSDTVNQIEFRSVSVTGAGVLSITSSNGNTMTKPVVAGEIVPIGGVRLNLATTATGLFLIY